MSPRIEEIPLAKFDLSLSQMRIINMPRILQVEKSMRLHGQLQAVVARENEGVYQIIDGFKRFYAAEDLMMETLECRVLEIDLQGAKVLLLSYNRSPGSMEAWEEAMVLKDLISRHNMDQGSLAKLTGYSRSWVSRRLALIDKLDETVCSEIKMGTLTSSHGRALIRLPRGNQGEFARAIMGYRLTSRQSDALAEAFIKAKDQDKQQYILTHPEQVLNQEHSDAQQEPYDVRLSGYGNELMQSIVYAIQAVQILLTRLDDHRFDTLNETQKMIITPGFKKVSTYTKKLTYATSHLQIQNPIANHER